MNALAWLNPGRWMLYIGLVLALWLGYTTWREHQRELGREEMRAEFARQAQAADTKREAVTQAAEREVVRVVKQIEVVTETIVKEVPVYVQADAPPLPGGFRVLHDAAASGQVPDPAALPDAAAVPAAAAATTVAENYGACRADQARLSALLEWVRAQQALQQ